MIPRIAPRVIPSRIPAAVNSAICVSSEIKATPRGPSLYSRIPPGPYLPLICAHDSNSTAYPKASPTAPPTMHPRIRSRVILSVSFI